MRVTLLLYGSLETISGGFLYDRKLVHYLSQQGDEVQVVSLPWVAYPLGLALNFSFALYRHLLELEPEVILEDELAHPSLVGLNRLLKRQRPIPIFTIVHHLRSSESRPAWQNHGYRQVEKAYLQSVDGCIYNSRTTRLEVEKVLGSGKNGVVAYPGGDIFPTLPSARQIVARALAPGPLRVVFVGNVISRKGLDLLLTGLAGLASNDWVLTVVGSRSADPAYLRHIQRQIRRLNLENRVTFTGSLSDQDLADHLGQSHILAVPSRYEGFGIVYLEGMALGLPALATTAGAAPELITHRQDGFLVAPEDPAAITRTLEILLQDRDRLAAMGLAAQARFRAHPSWQDTCARIRRFLLQYREQ